MSDNIREGLFTAGADGGGPRLIGGTCRSCQKQHFPVIDTCPYCAADAIDAGELPTTGTLWAWTTVTAAPPGYVGPVPFGFGVVELGQCLRLVTRLTESDADSLEAGQAMHLVLDDVGDDADHPVRTWAFAPSAS